MLPAHLCIPSLQKRSTSGFTPKRCAPSPAESHRGTNPASPSRAEARLNRGSVANVAWGAPAPGEVRFGDTQSGTLSGTERQHHSAVVKSCFAADFHIWHLKHLQTHTFLGQFLVYDKWMKFYKWTTGKIHGFVHQVAQNGSKYSDDFHVTPARRTRPTHTAGLSPPKTAREGSHQPCASQHTDVPSLAQVAPEVER